MSTEKGIDALKTIDNLRFGVKKGVNMDIEIQLLGYKGRLTHVTYQAAYPPLREEDELLAHITFDEPYPENTISTAISIPAGDYLRGRFVPQPKEFLHAIKARGEEQLRITLKSIRDARAYTRARDKRRKELDALAKSIQAKFEQE